MSISETLTKKEKRKEEKKMIIVLGGGNCEGITYVLGVFQTVENAREVFSATWEDAEVRYQKINLNTAQDFNWEDGEPLY